MLTGIEDAHICTIPICDLTKFLFFFGRGLILRKHS